MKKHIRDFLVEYNLFDLIIFLYDQQKILEQIQEVNQPEKQIEILAYIIFSLSNKGLDFHTFYARIKELFKSHKFETEELKHLSANLTAENTIEFVKEKFRVEINLYERIVEGDTNFFPIFSKEHFPKIQPKDIKPELFDPEEFRNVNSTIIACGYFSRYDFERALTFAEYTKTIVNNTLCLHGKLTESKKFIGYCVVGNAFEHLISGLVMIKELDKAVECYCKMEIPYGLPEKSIAWIFRESSKIPDKSVLFKFLRHAYKINYKRLHYITYLKDKGLL